MKKPVALIAAAALVAGGYGVATVADEDTPTPTTTASPSAPPEPTPSPTVSGPDEPTVKPTKIAIIVRENKGYNQVRKGAPYSRSLEKYGLATNMFAWGHPSQPNYVVEWWGTNKGITSNNRARVSGQSLLGKIPAGDLWLFAKAMGSDNCRAGQYGYYHERHVPGVTAKDEKALCEKYVVGYNKILPKIANGTLPKVSFIVPDNCKNAHDCSLSTSEAWLKTEIERLMAGPDYKSGKLVIVSTWDEDNKAEGNHIHTVVIHPSLDHKVVTTKLSLYSIHKTMAEYGGVTPIGTKGRDATSLTTAFGLPVPTV